MPRKDRLRVAMVSTEAYPYSKVGGLGDMASSLAKALLELDVEARLFTPLYAQVRQFQLQKREDLGPIRIGEQDQPGAVYVDAAESDSLHYFIENERFFGRPGIYDDPDRREGYKDNFERFNFLALASLKAIQRMGWKPDLVHCHDCHTALIPAYLRSWEGREWAQLSTLFTIHNLAYQGVYQREKSVLTGLPAPLFEVGGPFEYYGQLNVMKAGICYADLINTVSSTYAKEIQTKEQGCGLEGVLAQRKEDLYGVLNGIDTGRWDPQTDPLIWAPFSAQDLVGKRTNKRKLQQLCGFSQDDVPLMALVARLVDQKGIDLLLSISQDLNQMNCQLVILGTGNRVYEEAVRNLAVENPERYRAYLEFNEPLTHQIEAGADIFLMPSRYEPCGLNQMYSMRYGTIPLVRRTGGLADTVRDFDLTTGKGNGFTFQEYRPEAFLEALQRALGVWQKQEDWRKVMLNAMREDFSWRNSARRYLDLYRRTLSRRR